MDNTQSGPAHDNELLKAVPELVSNSRAGSTLKRRMEKQVWKPSQETSDSPLEILETKWQQSYAEWEAVLKQSKLKVLFGSFLVLRLMVSAASCLSPRSSLFCLLTPLITSAPVLVLCCLPSIPFFLFPSSGLNYRRCPAGCSFPDS